MLRPLAVAVVFGLALVASVPQDPEQDNRLPLPLCPPKSAGRSDDPGTRRKSTSNLLLVSTLDGALTALSPDGGQVLWNVNTEPGAMLSSTISQMELTNNARWVKLIPSLAGGLYKFDGETVEPIPLDAENLLKSSFKFADGTVMTGFKETRTYGLDLGTGNVRYECSINGCDRKSDEGSDDLNDVVVVQRETQTVRAVEPRTGAEKWNFSVSQHHLELHAGIHELCRENDGFANLSEDQEELPDDLDDPESEIKAVVADGVICSVDKLNAEKVNWKRKFETPIVHAWRVVDGKMYKVNLFSSSHIPKSTEGDGRSPVLYIGSFDKQLYIQENPKVAKDEADSALGFPKVNWRPYLISADSRTPVINHGSSQGLPLLSYDKNRAEKTAMAVFQHPNLGYPYDAGWYFYREEDPTLNEILNDTGAVGNGEAGEEEEEEQPTIQIVFVSLWYWWKEVTLISFLTAIMMNVLITRPLVENIRTNFKRRLNLLTSKRVRIFRSGKIPKRFGDARKQLSCCSFSYFQKMTIKHFFSVNC